MISHNTYQKIYFNSDKFFSVNISIKYFFRFKFKKWKNSAEFILTIIGYAVGKYQN